MKTINEYLSHCYPIPEMPSVLPLPSETFVASWKDAAGQDALDFLMEITCRSSMVFPLKDKGALRIFLKKLWEDIFRLLLRGITRISGVLKRC